ncbi:E3 ubiquitin-protein ligase RNF138 [Tachysurus fulvidraco]|uniref:E3 ubiquitin-protein ligase RNF138 n=1 Tax=Tachysurus fulvidraco TaxID=1234273 RepID=UPI000F4DEDE1|nr:E3 ubiquitin-protein ligase RNF138 [Tachysurus fulvidraco]
MDDDCPVCKGPLENPSQPVQCCRKVFCKSCLRQAILTRPCCPCCRSPINDAATLALGSAIPLFGLQGRGDLLQTAGNVSPRIQAVLDRLRAESAQTSQITSTPNVSLPDPLTLNTAVQPIRRRPVPRPRLQGPRLLNAVSIPANTSPQSDDLDAMNWQDVQDAVMATGSLSGYNLRTYNCPYCQLGNLDDLELRDHCNIYHLSDRRQIVCPVCVPLPHGNPTYCSRDFIGHLDLRHSYYIDDITNVHQTDHRNVSPRIQAVLDRLRAASAQTLQITSTPNVSLPGPLALNTAVQPTTRPVPRPRLQGPGLLNAVSIPANTSPQSDDLDAMNWQDVQDAVMATGSLSGYNLRTYNCPYCQLGNLDDLELRDHCNIYHLSDRRQIVCPVCVSLPHGNPTYCSRDFIGHLNLRHSYYIDDITNVHQTDHVNLQDAILRSLRHT